MSAQLFRQYSQFEDGLVKKFHTHPLYRSFHKLSKEKFIEYLLQIGFIAQNFVKWYETAKLGMQFETAREVVRDILRDEIPQSGTTHQDDRLYDLNLIGASTEQVRNVKPSAATRKTIERFYELVRFPQQDYDLRVMITLRIAGEVLVAEQYEHIIRYMRVSLGIQGSQSRFYFPHWQHDLKGAKVEGEPGHTDSFDKLLESMITDERKLEVAKDAAEKAFEARSGIHDQFLPFAQIVITSKRVMMATVAGVLLAVVGWGVIKLPATIRQSHAQAEREKYQQFLAGLPAYYREFYFIMDRHRAELARQKGSVDELAKVGTWATHIELVQGRGP